MTTLWEDRVYSDPDEVDLDHLFRDVRGDDERQQYEAAAGLYWLADFSPERLREREDTLFGLLGALPDFWLKETDGSEQVDGIFGTREWVARAIGIYLQTVPESIPRVLDSLGDPDVRTREDASRALAYATGLGRTNEPARRSAVERYLDEEWATIVDSLNHENEVIAANALFSIAAVTSNHCDEASELVSEVDPKFQSGNLKPGTIPFLREVALCNPDRASAIVDRLLSFFEFGDSNTDVQFRTTAALVAIADRRPAALEGTESAVRELVDHEYEFVQQHARAILDDIDDSEPPRGEDQS